MDRRCGNALNAAEASGTAQVIRHHSGSRENGSAPDQETVQTLNRRADLILADAEELKEQLIGYGIEAGKIRVVQTGKDLADTVSIPKAETITLSLDDYGKIISENAFHHQKAEDLDQLDRILNSRNYKFAKKLDWLPGKIGAVFWHLKTDGIKGLLARINDRVKHN